MGAGSATGGVLGTLIPTTGGGIPTAGWRAVQDFDDVWLSFNAWFNGTVWAQDNTAKLSFSKHYDVVNNFLEFLRMRAGQTTWEKMLQLAPPVGAIANFFQLVPSIAGQRIQMPAVGTDVNIDVDVVPKGAGVFRIKNTTNNRGSASGAGGASASGTYVSTGVGFSITPTQSGSVFIVASCRGQNNTAGDATSVTIYQNTTGVPVLNAGVGTDTQQGNEPQFVSPGAGNYGSLAPIVLVTGLTLGTTYSFYVAYKVIAGGTSTVDNIKIVGVEW